MADKRISVIIPVHNGAETIGQCLSSLQNSLFTDYECIVVDDHSTDHTLDVVEPFDVHLIRLDRQNGAAFARNRGAEAACGEILFFIDADVELHPESLGEVDSFFNQNTDISAVFGSYDDLPARSNFFSQYKNLFHHFIHQTSQAEAATFFSACGAIKREIFFRIGMFNDAYRMMDDVDLGYRLKCRKHRIRLNKQLYVKHLKYYSFLSLVKSDFFDRAIPWTVLMLRKKERTSDLNLKPTHKMSALGLMNTLLCLLLAVWMPDVLWAVPFFLVTVFCMNLDCYRFFLKKRGSVFVLKAIPVHFFYYLYSSVGFVVGFCQYYLIDGNTVRKPD